MLTGNINLSGLNAKQMEAVIQAQAASAGTLSISQIQPTNANSNPPSQVYNGVVLSWTDEAGFRMLSAMLQGLVSNLGP